LFPLTTVDLLDWGGMATSRNTGRPTGRRTARKTASARGSGGRPRSQAVDAAILEAALALFVEDGVAGASLEKIARRARVAKTSIYRRWPSREALLAQAIEMLRSTVGPSVEGLDRTPPAAFAGLLLEACGGITRPQIRTMMLRLLGSIADAPNLLAVYRDTYLMPRRAAFVRALGRMQQAGLMPREADADLVADTLIGALIQRMILAPPGGDTPETLRAYMGRLLRQAGIATT
jgi:AcrR family transcriptional regulator